MSTTSRPIVVGIDGTRASERALKWALGEAVVRGCPLNVVNAWNYEPLADCHAIRQIVLGSTSMHRVRHAHAPVVPVTDRELAETTS